MDCDCKKDEAWAEVVEEVGVPVKVLVINGEFAKFVLSSANLLQRRLFYSRRRHFSAFTC